MDLVLVPSLLQRSEFSHEEPGTGARPEVVTAERAAGRLGMAERLTVVDLRN